MTNYKYTTTQNQSTGVKDDVGKARLDLVDPEFIYGVGEALTYGANKYGPNNWQNVENPKDRYYAAALRHLLDYRAGTKIDLESNLSHLKHVAANIMFLLHFEEVDNGRRE